MIKILAIGNSFSEDATAYLYEIAKTEQVELKVVNLYIGGCSLEMHWQNINSGEAAYVYELNGQHTDRKISIKEALKEDNWDYVTLQQVSSESGLIETYSPFLLDIHNYVSKYAPKASQLLHQTWAYELDSDHPAFTKYHCNQREMYDALKTTYQCISNQLSMDLIPCGDVIQTLRSYPTFDYTKGGMSLCRDGFHMSLVYGRYAVAATWYEYLLKKNIQNNTFLPPALGGESLDPQVIQLIKDVVHSTAKYNC